MDGKIDSSRNLRSWRMRIELNDKIYNGMKKLKLRGKELDHPPREVFLLTELEVLDLSPERQACLFYHLPCVPPAISRLRSLRVLMLDTNELTILPMEICYLECLEKLSISNNNLCELPQGFSQLSNLSSLHAANNDFEQFPNVVCFLEKLTFLDFSDNCLTALPDEIGQLDNLETLLLYSNNLQHLPDSICTLVRLRCLWIGKNMIQRLPRGIERLSLLDWGRSHTLSPALDGNPLVEPPIDVCKQGMGAIADYFRNLEQDDQGQ